MYRKPIPIQGTTMKLDTPEQIEAWIAERKKRFPTAERVQEKDQKMKEAIARGQLSPMDTGFQQRKKRRTDDYAGGEGDARRGQRGRGRGQFGDRGRGRGRGRDGRFGQDVEGGDGRDAVPSTSASVVTRHELPPRPAFSYGEEPAKVAGSSEEETSSDSDSDGVPEVISSKPPPELASQHVEEEGEREQAGPMDEDRDVIPEVAKTETKDASGSLEPAKKPFPRQPRPPPRNPFAPRSSLLKNVRIDLLLTPACVTHSDISVLQLLTPEIRMTVSNLSQAIRFLVDNDFLENVELKPGQASERMIEVVGEHPASVPSPNP